MPIKYCDGCGKWKDKTLCLKNDVWKEICKNFPDPNDPDFLCPDCMEKYLGRKINRDDLKMAGGWCPINNWWVIENNQIEFFKTAIRKAISHFDRLGLDSYFDEEIRKCVR